MGKRSTEMGRALDSFGAVVTIIPVENPVSDHL